MTSRHHAPVHIPSKHHGAPLSAQQKKFNRHIERIAQQRTLLTDWETAITAYRERHSREFVPLQQAQAALLVELVQHLDAHSSDKKLTKAERRDLSEAITDRLAVLISAVPDEATRASLKEIYNRHSGSDYDAEEAEGTEAARKLAETMARDMFGFDLDLEGADLESPEDLLRRMAEQMHAQKAQAEEQRAAHRAARPRKPNARERKAQEEASQATQSVREIYRKLASHLHPDRETDPAERERKTALMQRVNQAYADNKLLDLLQLQLEVEQIDPEHIAGLSEARLKHYNRVLAEQLSELQMEVDAVQAHFAMEFGLDPYQRLKPARVMGELRTLLQTAEYQNIQLRKELSNLRTGLPALKSWIKAERQKLKEMDAFDEFDDFDEFGDWI
ncbi:MAG: J domain-containing protein [Proteobacteria bacterium]|nr:J domain-containing protein [Pseudomonadota bacterium]MBS0495776.1 J domain-containing protein [Pseudomonadota bacterium]